MAILWEKDNPRRIRLDGLVEDTQHPLLALTEAELKEYFESRRKRFTDDPIFFDPDADEPRSYPEYKLRKQAAEAMADMSLPASQQYTRFKTGLLITPDNRDRFTPAQINAWDDSLEEYELPEERAACN